MTGQPADDVADQLRRILAELTGDAGLLEVSARTPLLRDGIGLDSLGGTILLTQVRRQFGVDVAGEDLNLDAMATLGTLAEFIVSRRGGASAQGGAGPQGPADTDHIT